MPFFERIECLRNRRQGCRSRHQPQRVPGRGRVDHDHVVTQPGQACDVDQPRQLVDTGYRQVDQRFRVVAIEDSTVFDDVRERLAMTAAPPREGARRIELHRFEPRRDSDGPRREPPPEHVAKRMGGIGGNDEDTATGARFGDSPGGRASRLADAAFAAVENED